MSSSSAARCAGVCSIRVTPTLAICASLVAASAALNSASFQFSGSLAKASNWRRSLSDKFSFSLKKRKRCLSVFRLSYVSEPRIASISVVSSGVGNADTVCSVCFSVGATLRVRCVRS